MGGGSSGSGYRRAKNAGERTGAVRPRSLSAPAGKEQGSGRRTPANHGTGPVGPRACERPRPAVAGKRARRGSSTDVPEIRGAEQETEERRTRGNPLPVQQAWVRRKCGGGAGER